MIGAEEAVRKVIQSLSERELQESLQSRKKVLLCQRQRLASG
jgi:hypothetical protein